MVTKFERHPEAATMAVLGVSFARCGRVGRAHHLERHRVRRWAWPTLLLLS